ncbi:MAG: MBL fold metallo-hydrolase [Alphaproteobacteria bacterium]
MTDAGAATLRVTILGCGTSTGVPRIGNDWGKCDPDNPKNRRSRCSILVEQIAADGGVTRILIDTSPDMREQVLAAGVNALDGVLYTHAHADHIHGIDDLRGFKMLMRRRVDVYAGPETLAHLKSAFAYCFETPAGGAYPPILDGHEIHPFETFVIDGAGGPVPVLPIPQVHGDIGSLAFRFDGRFGALAYCPDVNDLSDDAVEALRGLDMWIVDALRHQRHPSHFSLSEALAWIDKLGPKQALLTHMHNDLDYAAVLEATPDHVAPAHDGMVVALPNN